MNEYLVTSESVTEGHPDKLCDQISDGILDRYLEQDPEARVAVEVMASKNTIMIAGQVSARVVLDVTEIARQVIRDIGYDDEIKGLDYQTCLVLTNINHQSADIARGVDQFTNREPALYVPSGSGCRWVRKEGEASGQIKDLGAGDQGIMYGYASNETANYLPITMDLASKLARRLGEIRKTGQVEWLYPDGKTQVTMKYDENERPLAITSIVISAQHRDGVELAAVKNAILREIIKPVIDDQWLTPSTSIHINPTGRFVIGGPMGDTGLTGRKIMVDTYGGVGKHGGGAFSGKDPTKVDRTGAYMARYVAKNIVAAGLADRCEVSLAYAIGLPEPEAVRINTFDTEHIDRAVIESRVRDSFSFSVINMIKTLKLKRPQFLKTAAYGHFGREDQGFAWEETNQMEALLNNG
ncbi:methionine adenosyltransferase [Acetobacterium bakii]|uniref:S-adenosylmethionine synthase n=1 Tax=Acetobacterium bakii TaxID=52689 RepID=A0A0L6TVF4_9FIRM|nr:methionine adenosyltransferase [Acetobacterium bakii]KNZ40254.1 S-adenosylmethionine synthetase [Acetobacterium bakii]